MGQLRLLPHVTRFWTCAKCAACVARAHFGLRGIQNSCYRNILAAQSGGADRVADALAWTVFADEVDWKRGGSPGQRKLHDYLVSKSVRSNKVLEALQQKSLDHRRSYMLSPPDSIAILQLFAKLTAAKTAIEVGVYTGYTALGLALGLPAGSKLYALDISKEFTSIGKPYWEEAGVADTINLRIGPAAESLEKLLKEIGPNSTDLAFIDADKPNYDLYYEQLLKLVRPGGVIIIDNVLWSGSVIDESDQSEGTKAIRALNDKIINDPRVHPAMLRNSDGITVAYKN